MAELHKATPNKTPTQTTVFPEHYPRGATHPLPELPQSHVPSSATVTDCGDEDLVYNLVRREVNDYQSLDRGQHPHPWTDHPASSPVMSQPVSPKAGSSCPPKSQTSPSPACPSYRDAMQGASDNTRSEPRPPPQHPFPPTPQPDGADEIVELSNRPGGATPASQDNEQNVADGGGGGRKREIEFTNIPNTNFAIACMVTFCFNLPLGILAMYFSLKAVEAYQDGHTKLGQKKSRWSIFISLLGIAITTVIVSSIVFYIAMEQKTHQNNAYVIKSSINL